MPPKKDKTASDPKTQRRRSGRTSVNSDKAKVTATAGKKNGKDAGKDGNDKDANVDLDTVDWDKDNYTLSFSLMTAITDDTVIKNALFPKVGPNPSTRSGGGKPKTDHYWEICKTLFTDHPEHGTAFKVALQGGKKERGPWTTKIKNRLARMMGIVKKGRKMLGQTGEGIKREEDITEELPEAFRNKWEELKAKCPYYFQLLELIAERPNHVPAGLGNSETPVEDGVIFGADSDRNGEGSDYEANDNEDKGEEEDTGSGVDESEDADQHANTGGSGSEGEEDGGNEHCNEAGESDIQAPETKAGQKRKASGGKPKTPARQGTSTPASKNSKDASMQGSAKRFKGALVFEELVKTEETTRQMELQVEAEKVRFNTKRVEAKMQREKIKMEHEKNKLELLRLKLEIHKEQAKANQHPIHAPPIVDPLFQVALPSSSSFASGSQTPMSHHSHLSEGAYSFGGLEMGNGMSDST